MNEAQKSTRGDVYILEVKDLVLPVCKIGRTTRDPYARCAEINHSSTGDFIWAVKHHVTVEDCFRLESIVHSHLGHVRQKGREFFNIGADEAFDQLQAILTSHPDVKAVEIVQASDAPAASDSGARAAKRERPPFRKGDVAYAQLLHSFTSILGVKGRPFGQLNRPAFGMSDGVEGVQWNVAIYRDTQKIRLKVNLEGKKYSAWPIASFLLAELARPTIAELRSALDRPDKVFIDLARDAWQAAARPDIVEKLIGGKDHPVTAIDNDLWQTLLREALTCLDESHGYRGRGRQAVTLASPSAASRTRTMAVSPHLGVWTPIEVDVTEASAEQLDDRVREAGAALRPAHEWVAKLAQT